MLYKRCFDMIECLLESHSPVTIIKLARQLQVSERTVRNDLAEIDDWLHSFGAKPVSRTPGVGLLLSDPDGAIRQQLRAKGDQNYIRCAQERVRVIVGQLLLGGRTSITALSDKLMVSGATISGDMKKVKKWMDGFGICMVSKPHLGIFVDDSEQNIRRGCVMLLREILETGTRQPELIAARFLQVTDQLANYLLEPLCISLSRWRQDILSLIDWLCATNGQSLSDNGYCAMFLYLLIDFTRIHAGHPLRFPLQVRQQLFDHCALDFSLLAREIHLRTGLVFFEEDLLMLGVEWLSLRKFGAMGDVGADMVNTARELLYQIAENSDLDFDVDEGMVLETAAHLNIMEYRLLLGVPAENNQILNEIELAYPSLCAIVRRQLIRLLQARRGQVSETLCNREAVYIAMHIIAGLKRPVQAGPRVIRVVLVCASAVATTRILESRLKAVFADLQVMKSLSYNEFVRQQPISDCDLIISTLPLVSDGCPCITVSPLLTPEDIQQLAGMLARRAREPDLNLYIGASVNIAGRSLGLSPEQKIKFTIDLTRGFEQELQEVGYKRTPTLRGLLTAPFVRTKVPVKNCYEAIRAAGGLLLEQRRITQRHIDDMVRLKKKLGGYMVIDRQVAMPHLLAPELSGPCMSLITLEKPVRFHHPDNDPVDIVILLLSNNNTAHIKVLEELIELLQDPIKKEKMRGAKSPAEILSLL